MILVMNETGKFEEYKEPYATIDLPTEEDFKKFEEILEYYKNREQHDRQIKEKNFDEFIAKCESAKFTNDEVVLSDIHQGANSGLCMAIHFAKEMKEKK